MIAPALDELSTDMQGKVRIAMINIDDRKPLIAERGVCVVPYAGAVGSAMALGMLHLGQHAGVHRCPKANESCYPTHSFTFRSMRVGRSRTPR